MTWDVSRGMETGSINNEEGRKKAMNDDRSRAFLHPYLQSDQVYTGVAVNAALAFAAQCGQSRQKSSTMGHVIVAYNNKHQRPLVSTQSTQNDGP